MRLRPYGKGVVYIAKPDLRRSADSRASFSKPPIKMLGTRASQRFVGNIGVGRGNMLKSAIFLRDMPGYLSARFLIEVDG